MGLCLTHNYSTAFQVMGEAFWGIQDGPNHWAATLRWLCFSDQTLLLAVKEANRLFRQLSLGGPAALQAAYSTAFEVKFSVLIACQAQLPTRP